MALRFDGCSPPTSRRSRTVTFPFVVVRAAISACCRFDYPPDAEDSTEYHNYRQCLDNPPQFYGMLCHEVFAPHRLLHALRVIISCQLATTQREDRGCRPSWESDAESVKTHGEIRVAPR
jgi:hypothetical protein